MRTAGGTVTGLQHEIAQCLREKYGPLVLDGIPELPGGLRLEVHPLVYRDLTRDISYAGFASDRDPLEQIGVPVVVTAAMSPGTWRLVIITEDVLAEGGL